MEIDVIGNLDVNNLGCYCNAFSYYISVTKQLKKENKVIKNRLKMAKFWLKIHCVICKNVFRGDEEVRIDVWTHDRFETESGNDCERRH